MKYFRFFILNGLGKTRPNQFWIYDHEKRRYKAMENHKRPSQHDEVEPNLKKIPTPTEYGVWKLILCSFTYQSQKNPIP